jgi:hypothetical protein
MLALVALIATACSGSASGSTSPSATASSSATLPASAAPTPSIATSPSARPAPTDPTDLLADQLAALKTVTKVDDYPLYAMRYQRSYDAAEDARLMEFARSSDATGGCSLFAALANKQDPTFGRNFDWPYTPGLMLFYTPPDGYASISMVPVLFLDYTSRLWGGLDKAAVAERQQLLNAPAIAVDGMNEKGLVVGFARVPEGRGPYDPSKPTIATLYVIHEMLDHAATIEEAIKLLDGYNVWAGPKQPLHWLVSDRSGRAALLEFQDGKLAVTWNPQPWHAAVNFVSTKPEDDPDNAGWRYAILASKLDKAKGNLSAKGAMDLLDAVHNGTQWSVVYHPNTGDVEIAMGGDYTTVHTFHLDMKP